MQTLQYPATTDHSTCSRPTSPVQMSACDNYVLVHAVAPQPLFSRGTESVHSKGGHWEALWRTSEGFSHPSTRSTLKEQPWKALSSTFVRPAGNSIDVNEEQSLKAYPPMLMSPAGRAIDVIEEQPSKALSPMVVRPAGNSIDVNEEQPTKVYSSMLVSPAGSAIEDGGHLGVGGRAQRRRRT